MVAAVVVIFSGKVCIFLLAPFVCFRDRISVPVTLPTWHPTTILVPHAHQIPVLRMAWEKCLGRRQEPPVAVYLAWKRLE